MSVQVISQENKVVVSKEEMTNNVVNYYKANELDSKFTEVQKDHFLQICIIQGLNPLLREVYAVPMLNRRTNKIDMNIVVSYEQYLKRAEMNPNFDGFTFEYGPYNVDLKCYEWIECIVYRSDRKMPTKARVLFHEYNQPFGLWKSKPVVMLEKVAISRAFRWAFPIDFKGMPYTREEMPQQDETQDIPAEPVAPAPAEPRAGEKKQIAPAPEQKQEPEQEKKSGKYENSAIPLSCDTVEKVANLIVKWVKNVRDLDPPIMTQNEEKRIRSVYDNLKAQSDVLDAVAEGNKIVQMLSEIKAKK